MEEEYVQGIKTPEKTKLRNAISANEDRKEKRETLIWLKRLLTSDNVPVDVQKWFATSIFGQLTKPTAEDAHNSDNLNKMADRFFKLGGDSDSDEVLDISAFDNENEENSDEENCEMDD